LWRSKWYWDSFLSQCFGFILLVSFHRNSILIQFITNAILCIL
jgi:hypothetical protein